MTDLAQPLFNLTGCPVAHYDDLNVPTAPVGWHQANLDAKREEAPVRAGLANGHQYLLVPRMADIRRSYQSSHTFSNSPETPTDPNPPYLWAPRCSTAGDTSHGASCSARSGRRQRSTLKPNLRRRFTEVLDGTAEQGWCEFVADVALLFPNVIFMDLMGLPRASAELREHGGQLGIIDLPLVWEV